MARYVVTLDKGDRIDLGFFGTSRVLDSVTVTADDEAEARARAREEKPGRIVEVQEVFSWAITLRGRDKRRKETFVVAAARNEQQALDRLRDLPAVWRFAGSVRSASSVRYERLSNVLTVERRPLS